MLFPQWVLYVTEVDVEVRQLDVEIVDEATDGRTGTTGQ
jgi:hypothetical protein